MSTENLPQFCLFLFQLLIELGLGIYYFLVKERHIVLVEVKKLSEVDVVLVLED